MTTLSKNIIAAISANAGTPEWSDMQLVCESHEALRAERDALVKALDGSRGFAGAKVEEAVGAGVALDSAVRERDAALARIAALSDVVAGAMVRADGISRMCDHALSADAYVESEDEEEGS
jgi:hypothetical protein